MTVEEIVDDEDDGEFRDTMNEEDKNLDWDVDNTQDFVDRSSYFIHDPTSAAFDGFSKKTAEEVREFIEKKGGEIYICPIKDEKLLQ